MLEDLKENDVRKNILCPSKAPPSQMIWGEMSVNGTAALYCIPAGVTMNGS